MLELLFPSFDEKASYERWNFFPVEMFFKVYFQINSSGKDKFHDRNASFGAFSPDEIDERSAQKYWRQRRDVRLLRDC